MAEVVEKFKEELIADMLGNWLLHPVSISDFYSYNFRGVSEI